MKEKKLDFNFLGDEPKVEKTVHVPVTAKAPSEDTVKDDEKLGFIEYFKLCYKDFVQFSKQRLSKKNPPYLIFVAWLVGVGTVADRTTGGDYANWGEVWAAVLFGGIISGALIYYIGGWFYNLRISWSKGKDDIDTSRNVYVFATLPVSVASIIALFFNHISYGSDYFDYYNYSEGTTVDGIFLFVALAAIVYSIRLSYKAATEVLHADKGRAVGWFIVLPVLFYIAIIALTLAST